MVRQEVMSCDPEVNQTKAIKMRVNHSCKAFYCHFVTL
jgi:hypothetical protein